MLAILFWTVVAVALLGLAAKVAANIDISRERERAREAHAFDARVAAVVRAELAAEQRRRQRKRRV